MQLDNFNINSISIFLIIFFIGILGFYFFYKRREKIKNKYFLLFNQKKSFYLKYLFLFISLIIILFGIFEIKYGEKEETTKVNGVDVVFVLDVSKSMNALDFKDGEYGVSRLDYAKTLISDYILRNRENRYSLVIFAGDAISILPLTTDTGIFTTFLKNVDYKNLSKQGTNLEKAFSLGVSRLKKAGEEDKRAKVLVLISDGGDEGEQVDFDYISNIVGGKITTFVIGIGKTSGAKIPNGYDMFGNIVYQTYRGVQVITKLNEKLLKKLASSISGEYLKADKISDLEKVSDKINTLEKKAIIKAGGKEKKDFARILSIISLLFFMLYLFGFSRKKK